MSEQAMVENNSGTNGIAPDFVAKKFNWGAFLLTWIWGLGNKTYITLVFFAACALCIIPIIGAFAPLGCSIWFGIKGNEWAWKNKRFESVGHFHSNQKKWAIAGVIVLVLGIVLNIIAIFAMIGLNNTLQIQ